MKKVGDMKLYSFEELLEEDYGKVGTPERDAFERSVAWERPSSRHENPRILPKQNWVRKWECRGHRSAV